LYLGGDGQYILQLTKKFNEDMGLDYLGSRDVDLGFHIGPSMNKTKLSQSTMKKALNILGTNGF